MTFFNATNNYNSLPTLSNDQHKNGEVPSELKRHKCVAEQAAVFLLEHWMYFKYGHSLCIM